MQVKISEDYILKYGEKYTIKVKLNKDISTLSENKKKAIEMRVLTDMVEKNNFMISAFSFRNPCYIDLKGTYTSNSITVKVLMLAIISIIGIWGLGYVVYSVSKLTDTSAGSFIGIGTLFLIGFGMFLFIRK